MKFTSLFPSACVIAAIAALYILGAQYLGITAMWLPFISWSVYALAGCKPALLPKMIIGFSIGMIIGSITVLAMVPVADFVGPTFALPLVVFFLTLFILLLELVKPIDMIPSYFFSYASFFAYFFGGFGGGTPLSVLPLFWILAMLGFGLGYVTSEIRRKMVG